MLEVLAAIDEGNPLITAEAKKVVETVVDIEVMTWRGQRGLVSRRNGHALWG